MENKKNIHEVEFSIKIQDMILFAGQKKLDVNSFIIKYINDIILVNQPEIKGNEDIITLAEYVAENVSITELEDTIEVFLPANYIPTENN